jgi:hypothetical protein
VREAHRGAMPVGFVNSVVADFQGNPEPLSSGFRPQGCIGTDSEERFERLRERLPVISQSLRVADDGEGSPFPSLLRFSAEQMLSSSTAKPLGGSRLPVGCTNSITRPNR